MLVIIKLSYTCNCKTDIRLTELRNLGDEELADLVKQDNNIAFEMLFNRYANKIFAFSRSYLLSVQDSEGLVQEVFVKLWEKRMKLDSTKSIKSFIFKIAVNIIYDLVRKNNVKRAYQEFAERDRTVSVNSTWHNVVHNETLKLLNQIISTLPEKRREVFKMSNYDGLSNDEIADRLNISKRTVENQLHRALIYVRQEFENIDIYILLATVSTTLL